MKIVDDEVRATTDFIVIMNQTMQLRSWIYMLLDGIVLKGYRSYSNVEGVRLTQFRKMNIFIGPNNIGKSNLVRFIKFLRNKRLFTSTNIPAVDAWDETNPLLDAELSFVDPITNAKNKIHIHQTQNEHLSIDGIPNSDFGLFMANHIRVFSDIRGLGSRHAAGYLQPMIDGEPITGHICEGAIMNYDWYKYYKKRMSEHLSALLSEKVEFSIKLSSENKKIENLDIEAEKRRIQQKTDNSKRFNHEHKPDNAEFIVILSRNSSNKEFSLSDLGMGVYQFVTILSALYTSMDDWQNIFFEEIELNMHTQALTQLMHILENNPDFRKFRFFFLTHSTSILDLISEDWSIHSFYRLDNGSTAARLCTKRTDIHRLIDGMGIKPSQLLLSNVVIWLEGPSDKIYINKWIEMKAKERGKTYIEGKHYSYVYYGGALLHHYRILLSDDLSDDVWRTDTLIDVMNISRYTAIICDSDLGGGRQKLKQRVEQIQASLMERKDLQSYLFQWVTAGREIENYVPKHIFEDVVGSKISKRRRLTYKGCAVNLPNPNNSSIADQDFTSEDSFDEFFAQMYLAKKDLSSEYGKFVIKNVSSSMDKIEIANHVTSLWEMEDFYILDLNEKIESLLNFIDKAQG